MAPPQTTVLNRKIEYHLKRVNKRLDKPLVLKEKNRTYWLEIIYKEKSVRLFQTNFKEILLDSIISLYNLYITQKLNKRN